MWVRFPPGTYLEAPFPWQASTCFQDSFRSGSSVEGPPHFPAHRRLSVQSRVLKIFLGQIFGQAQIPVLIILELVTNIDLVVRRICVDVIGFGISPDYRDFIRWELLKVLLLLRGGSNDGSETCRRKQILCLLCMGAACRQSYECEAGDKAESV